MQLIIYYFWQNACISVSKSFSVRRSNSKFRKSVLSVFAGNLQSHNCILSQIINTEHLTLFSSCENFLLLNSSPSYICRFCQFSSYSFFSHGATAPSGLGPPHYGCFTITLRHTVFGRTRLDERSARPRDFHLKTHNTHNRTIPIHRRDLPGYLLLRNS